MPFSYGSDALNELAQGVARGPADLSTKADVSALATTNAVVGTKQTTGEPIRLDTRVISSDTTLDPDFPTWVLKADTTDVTLTLSPIASLAGRQFTIICADTTHVPTVRVDPTTTDLLFIGANQGLTSLALPVSGYTLVLTALVDPFGVGLNLWLGCAVVEPRGGATVQALNTSGGDQVIALPPARSALGIAFYFKNSGSGGHSLTLNPDGTDTINGSAMGLALADGGTICLVAQTATNWTSVVGGNISIPPSVIATAEDTTSGNLTVTLPLAAVSVGLLLAYENTGTGSHTVTVSPDGGNTLDGNGLNSVVLAAGQTAAFIVEAGSTLNWLSIVKSENRSAPVATTFDTTGGDGVAALPAAASIAALYSFRNKGSGGHTLTVNPNGTDTIDGSGTGIAVPDGKTASFVVEKNSTTNWVLISLA